MPSGQLVALPRTSNRLGAENVETRAVVVGEDIEHPVVIPDARCPDASAVDVSAFHAVVPSKVVFIHAVAGQFPVHQVLGMHEDDCRVHVHRRAGNVIIVADTNGVGVFEFLIKQRVGISAVPVVGGPVFGRVGGGSGGSRRICGGGVVGQGEQSRQPKGDAKVFHVGGIDKIIPPALQARFFLWQAMTSV